jgi:hypothetical protein
MPPEMIANIDTVIAMWPPTKRGYNLLIIDIGVK